MNEEKNNKDSLLTEKELSARLHISVNHTGRLRKLGKLPWNKLGRSPRYDWTAVMDATKQQGGSNE